MTTAEQAYLFRHALLRDAAYQLQPPADRARLHLLVARLMQDLVESEETLAADISDHLWASRHAGGGDITAESRFTEVAARQAEAAFRNADAVRLWLRAAETLGADAAASAQVRAAKSAYMMGSLARAHDIATQALAAGGVGEREARGILSEICRRNGRPAEALEHAEAALRLSEARADNEGIARAIGAIANARYESGDIEASGRMYQQAIETLRAHGDPKLAASLQCNLAVTFVHTGRPEEGIALLRKAMEESHALDDPRGECFAATNLASLLGNDDQFEQAEPLYHRALGLAARTGDIRAQATVLANYASCCQRMGRHDEAMRVGRKGIDLLREVGDLRQLGTSLGILGTIVRDTGRIEEAETLLAQALDLHAKVGNRRFAALHGMEMAVLLARTGRRERALELWHQSQATLRQVGDTKRADEKIEEMRHACRNAGLPPLDQPESAP